MVRIVLVTALASLALAPSAASADAVCTLDFDVRFDQSGRFASEGAGQGICAGNVAGNALDPSAANPSIAGQATPDCLPATGTLRLSPRRAFEMWSPEHLELAGEWHAVGGALNGDLIVESTAVAISGTAAFASGCSGTGRLHVELVLGNERPAPAAAPQPRQESAPASSAPARKSSPRRKRACRGAKSRRAAKRCRRARR